MSSIVIIEYSNDNSRKNRYRSMDPGPGQGKASNNTLQSKESLAGGHLSACASENKPRRLHLPAASSTAFHTERVCVLKLHEGVRKTFQRGTKRKLQLAGHATTFDFNVHSSPS